MDKKMTHRIVSVLVVVALVIIVLPLVVNGMPNTKSPLQTAEIKAPPFPEPARDTEQTTTVVFEKDNMNVEGVEANTVAMNEEESNTLPPSRTGSMLKRLAFPEKYQAPHAVLTAEAASDKAGVATVASNEESVSPDPEAQAFPSSPMIQTALEAKEEMDKAQELALASANDTDQDDEIMVAKAGADDSVIVINNDHTATQVAAKPVVAMKTVAATAPVPAVKTRAPAARVVMQSAPARTTKSLAADVKASFAKPAATGWVVQVGTFRNKDNATRLVNTLRAKGYQAFAADIRHHSLTCVYVGPEKQQASAASLIGRIHRDSNLHGVVINYKTAAV